jgi:hypothetical protein
LQVELEINAKTALLTERARHAHTTVGVAGSIASRRAEWDIGARPTAGERCRVDC